MRLHRRCRDPTYGRRPCSPLIDPPLGSLLSILPRPLLLMVAVPPCECDTCFGLCVAAINSMTSITYSLRKQPFLVGVCHCPFSSYFLERTLNRVDTTNSRFAIGFVHCLSHAVVSLNDWAFWIANDSCFTIMDISGASLDSEAQAASSRH
ncbi:uncharacterized protein EI90DRAFT_1649861 [Cantharellus anzutake]|uniref:uncharacterized protein n=1 Tax=Cantharellus anzutake TaxID=1750568 RepID=UPI001907EDF4|nr:uncharacterized protein EI90DRAFT_1649861 [Cantharellus anzutake]KAF8327951.1 hypothetical protein EI90DRAFT_1649861 [Cantharellus anzutake]